MRRVMKSSSTDVEKESGPAGGVLQHNVTSRACTRPSSKNVLQSIRFSRAQAP
jgi:hypothetical protein